MARETIQDVKIGRKFKHHSYGDGMVTAKTKRTITATFENGNTSKITYNCNDAYFYTSDFR